ncbi:hypothetical protein CSAL01_08912 [Colletotrichum salicis]|uniref:Uncharacterized protein n=1 Tax=Colletotrichum salicis TaxID=1209931 RepID=A0A135V251_9PEZI|nr:hypothetical protein CSAL01_08912 [Colletotrichum salicis]
MHELKPDSYFKTKRHGLAFRRWYPFQTKNMTFIRSKRIQSFFACIVVVIATVISLRRILVGEIEQCPPVIGKNNTVFSVANVEHGLSNFHIATVFSLLERHPEITVHFASWSKIKPKIERISAYARKKTPQTHPAIFHELITGSKFLGGIRAEFFIKLDAAARIGSGHDFPVPWRDIPTNIYQMGSFAWTMMFNPELNERRKFLASHGLQDPINFFNIHQPGKGAFITQHTAVAAIPLDVVPANVVATGPIVISVASAEKQDPELAAWLVMAPTVFVNLGSLFEYDVGRARDMTGSLKIVMERTDVQVLWKLNEAASLKASDRRPLVEGFVASGRLRVSKWLTVDPRALLETEILSFRSIMAVRTVTTKPLNLYNYAARVEAIQIGVWGNKQSAPGFSLIELSNAFTKLVDGSSASLLVSQNAKKIQRALSRPGRDVAADEIARLAALGY